MMDKRRILHMIYPMKFNLLRKIHVCWKSVKLRHGKCCKSNTISAKKTLAAFCSH